MRNKGEFSWIIFLLLMEYALSDDTCERNTCIGPISYGMFLPRSAFTTKYHLSLYQCAIECHLRRQRCKSFNYRRSFVSCQLCEEDSGPGGIHLQPKAGSDHSNIDTWKNIPVGKCNEINCSWTEKCDSSKADAQSACVKTECPFAVLKPGVTIEPSNETAVRTKARYRCVSHDMERGSPLTTCQESSAEWSPTYFKCVCTTPPAKSGEVRQKEEVEVGQNYTYRCQDGLFGKRNQNPTITCLQDGSWMSNNFTCVCKTPPAKPGAKNETAEVEIGQNYTYRCQDGLFEKGDQNPTVTCLHNGSWTSTNFICAPSASCDMEYKNVSLGGSYFCIKFHDINKAFNEAMKLCESEKAKLLVITTKAQVVDAKRFTNVVSGWGTFLGMWNEINKNRWVSWDGQPVFPEWYPTEPNSNEDCANIYYRYNGVSAWYCTDTLHVLCHKKQL